MTAREFFYLVAEMREAQKAYLETRSSSVFRACRALENNVDREIRRVRKTPLTQVISGENQLLNDAMKNSLNTAAFKNELRIANACCAVNPFIKNVIRSNTEHIFSCRTVLNVHH